MNSLLVGLILYFVLIAGVAIWAWGKNRTKEDFILGGRRLGAWVIAFSERTAAESSWLILGLSGAFYAAGLVEVWTVVGCVAGIVFYWLAIARRLREVSEEYGAITLPEFFFRFCGRHGQMVRVVSMLIITFFFAFYVAAQFKGAAKTLGPTFGIDATWAMPLAAVVVVLYTMMGGFIAVCYTDVVQAVLMITTLVVMPVLGLVLIFSQGYDVGEAMRATGSTASLTGGAGGWAAVATAVGGLSWGLGYMGQPHLVTKFMAIDSSDSVKTGQRVAIVWTLLAYAGAALVGVVAITLIHHGQVPTEALMVDGAEDPERVLPLLARQLFPLWIAGILIAGAVAAMMSTADSQLLVATSTIVEDFTCRALGVKLSQKQLVLMSRLVTIGIGLLGYVLAVYSDDLIYDVVSIAWSGLGASFGPALLLALHWRGMTGAGVLASLLTGSISTVVWKWLPLFGAAAAESSVHTLDDVISVRFASFALALLAAIVVSKLSRRDPRVSPT